MTLDELKAQMPAQLRPWADEYGAAILAMTAEEIKALIALFLRGDVYAAYSAVLAKMASADVMAEWGKLSLEWAEANEANAKRIELQKAALMGVGKVLLAMALAAVGL